VTAVKIVTVTLNPAVDLTVYVDELRAGEINSVHAMRKDSGGKGINVSKVLHHLGMRTIATGLIGGATGEWLQKDLQRQNISADFVRIDGETRTNIKIIAKDGETQLNGTGPQPERDDLLHLQQKLDWLLEDGDALILAGSVPGNTAPSIYREMIRSLSKDVFVAVDTSGKALHESVGGQPDLLKPNREELSQWAGEPLQTEEEIVQAAQRLVERGVRHVLVSLGEQGSIYACEKGVFRAQIPRVEVRSTVGAGDATLAGFVGHFMSTGDAKASFVFANACGVATVLKEGSQVCDRREAESFLEKIQCIPYDGVKL
jgi:1-phosphofructokinase